MTTFCAWTIMDADTGERFSTTDFASQQTCERERNRLALTYGKEFCLRVAGIDPQGNFHEIEETD